MPSANSVPATSSKQSPTPTRPLPLGFALLLTLALVIIIREGAVVVCAALNISSAANIVGMLVMFAILLVWRLTVGLPQWLTQASNTLLVDSGFAFLPVSAGAGLLIFALGDELWGVVLTIVISTLLPLWGLGILANRWLNTEPTAPIAPTDNAQPSASQQQDQP